jgi:uncharacterized membrane protein
MRWAAIGFGLGAGAWLAFALVNLWEHRDAEYRRTAKYYLVPGAVLLGIAAIFGWLARSAG